MLGPSGGSVLVAHGAYALGGAGLTEMQSLPLSCWARWVLAFPSYLWPSTSFPSARKSLKTLMSQLRFLNLYSVYPGWFLGCAGVTLLKLQPGSQEADLTAPEVGELSCQLPGAAPHGQCCCSSRCSTSPSCLTYPRKNLCRVASLTRRKSLSSSRRDRGKAWLRGAKGLASWGTGQRVACKPAI